MSVVSSDLLGAAYTAVTTGIGGVGLVAFFNRWIVPGSSLEEMREERDEWQALYDKEREAHQATRDAFAAASQRGDAAIEAAKVTAALVEALRRQQ
jgi:hypothetical protein